jgi:SAM-dependent methyltransferase
MATARETDEMAHAATLPQADATSLVDPERLEAEVKEMYRHVAREEDSALHFEVGRGLALHLGYEERLLDAIPAEALASFAGVGYHLDLASLASGETVLDLGSGSGTDVFCAAVQVGETGQAVGVDFTDEQLAKARRLALRDGFAQAEFREASIEDLPFDDASFDVVISNGVINLSPVKHRVFAEAARVLRPGGRLAMWDISAAGRSRSARAATSTCGRRASRARSRAATTSRRSPPRACMSGRCAARTTASCPTGRWRRAARTRSRASRSSPPSRAEPRSGAYRGPGASRNGTTLAASNGDATTS